MKQLLFSAITILIALSATANNDLLLFKHLGLEDGLSQSTVYNMYQDSDGFMWFCTDAGLNKYDGYEFTVYKNDPSDTTTISSNFILEVYEDHKGGIWVGSGYHGLSHFDKKSEKFTRYQHSEGNKNTISSNSIRAIFEDSRHNLWVGTAGGGINIYNREQNNFTSIKKELNKQNTIESNFICSVDEDMNGNLWFGSTEGYIIKFDYTDSSFTNYSIFDHPTEDLFHTNFGYVYIDSENLLWYCTESGLICFNTVTETYKHYTTGEHSKSLNSNFISSIAEYEKGVFLISTDHGGLNLFNKNTGEFSYYTHNKFDHTTVKNNQLYNIYISPDGIVWIGSFTGSINYFDSKAIKFDQLKYLLTGTERTKCCNSVSDLTTDANGDIWVGYDGQGIDIFRPNKGIIKKIQKQASSHNTLSTNIVTSLHTDSQNNIWIGTYLHGLSKYDWSEQRFYHFEHSKEDKKGIHGNNVWCIYENDKNSIWVGTLSAGLGLVGKDGSLIKHYTNHPDNKNSISNNDIFDIIFDHNKDLWVATRSGLNRYNKSSDNFKQYISDPNNQESLFGYWVYCLFQDSYGNLWAGTDAGLNRYNYQTDNFTHFLIKYDDEASAVFDILEDNSSNLWISTNKGISKFNINNNTYRNYDTKDGLQGVEFNYTSTTKDLHGNLYFGGKNGFNIFNPDSIFDNKTIPKIYITKFKIFNKEISPKYNAENIKTHINFAKNVVLGYKQNVISIGFAAINYTNTQKNQYAYYLEGFDNDWNYVGTKREASYTNLNPGTYNFKVKGSNNDGYWNETPTELTIIITPPFWRTTWFITLSIIFIISFIGFLYYLKIKRLNTDKKILKQKVKQRTYKIEQQKIELEKHRTHLENLVEERTKELKVAKEKAEDSDRLKSAFLANMSHEIRTPMNSIVGFSELLTHPDFSETERNEFIGLINSNSHALLKLIEDILDVSLIEANQLIIRKENFYLNEIITQIHASFALTNTNSNLEILKTNELEHLNLEVYTDKGRLTQIITNLINNACKFTEEGTITLGVQNTNNILSIFIRDTGIGIPEEKMDTVFGRFLKSGFEPATARGVGLGLSISKQLAELLGGELLLESEVGKGSTFYFKIKLDTIANKT